MDRSEGEMAYRWYRTEVGSDPLDHYLAAQDLLGMVDALEDLRTKRPMELALGLMGENVTVEAIEHHQDRLTRLAQVHATLALAQTPWEEGAHEELIERWEAHDE